MDNSFYLKNGSVLWNGAFTPLDMACLLYTSDAADE